MASQLEIAHLAKVSQPIVSRVLSGRAREFKISPETEARVRAIAEALRYQPNQASHMLLGRQTKLIGVIVPLFADLHVGSVLDELNAQALQTGYSLLIVAFKRGEFDREEIRLLQSYRPDAFVVVGSTDFRQWDDSFLKCGKPIIQMGKPTEDKRIVTCGIDEEVAADLHIQHLAKLGHRRFAILGNATKVAGFRASRVKEWLRRSSEGLTLSCFYISDQPLIEAGLDAATYFMDATSDQNRPTAVVVTTDLVALSFMQRLAERGLDVPKDVSVSTYNDVIIPSIVRPTLTTIRQPLDKLAAACIDMIRGSRPCESVLLPPELIARESTAAPPSSR